MARAIPVEQAAPEWIAVGDNPRPRGEASAPHVSYARERHGSGERMHVDIDCRLDGYWASRCGEGFIDQVDIVGGRVLDNPGLPRVPAQVFSVALPFGADFDPEGVEVRVDREGVARERVQLRAIPRPQLEGTRAMVEPDPAAFERVGWFPRAAAVLRPAPTLDGMERLVARVNPLAFEPISGRLLVRSRIRIGFSCAVRNHGLYDQDSVDLLSPVLRGVLGSRQLVT